MGNRRNRIYVIIKGISTFSSRGESCWGYFEWNDMVIHSSFHGIKTVIQSPPKNTVASTRDEGPKPATFQSSDVTTIVSGRGKGGLE